MNNKFSNILKEKDYLIKSVINKLHIYENYEDFFQVGAIALYEAYMKYDPVKDQYHNMDVYLYYSILNHMKNELTRINKYKKIEICVDLYENDYLAPIIEDDLIKRIEMEDLLTNLTKEQQNIINLKRYGYKNNEIANILNISIDQLKYQLKLAFNKIRNIINKTSIN
ncbi:MAG TPA: sigma-70 family RNA polymerase sigma factor [Haloplasmataceae bacterium]